MLLNICCVMLLLVTCLSCSEDSDNPKYTSLPPQFSHVETNNLDGDSTLRVGERIIFTAVQSKKGKLLYKATYNWGNKKGDATHSFTENVIYDNNPANPTDTVVFAHPGTYTITLNAKYHISGNYDNINSTEMWEDGRVTYSTPSWQYYMVDIEKKVVVY